MKVETPKTPGDLIGAKVDGRKITNTKETVFLNHPGLSAANSRFSAPNQAGMYAATGKDPQAWNSVLEEMASHKVDIDQPLVFNSTRVSSNRVLDLTDSSVLKQLGLPDDLSENLLLKGSSKNDYYLSHVLGDVAQQKGFDLIKVPSAVDPSGVNIVFLGGF